MLDPFGLQNMRVKWRKWLTFQCNWKVAIEAFNETYHVATTHPQFNKFGTFRGWAKAQGKHSNIGYDAPKDLTETKSKIRLGSGDPRISTAEMQVYTLEETNATTTKTLVDAAKRLADELPEDTPPDQVLEPLADLGAQRRRRPRCGVAGHRSRASGQERYRLADLSELPDRPGFDDGAVLQRAAPRLRPQQLHLRSGLLRALPRRPRAADRMGVSGSRRPRLAHRSSRRISPTWRPYSRA